MTIARGKVRKPKTKECDCKRAMEALRVLVWAKTIKDTIGDTAQYRHLKKRGWRLAKKLVG